MTKASAPPAPCYPFVSPPPPVIHVCVWRTPQVLHVQNKLHQQAHVGLRAGVPRAPRGRDHARGGENLDQSVGQDNCRALVPTDCPRPSKESQQAQGGDLHHRSAASCAPQEARQVEATADSGESRRPPHRKGEGRREDCGRFHHTAPHRPQVAPHEPELWQDAGKTKDADRSRNCPRLHNQSHI